MDVGGEVMVKFRDGDPWDVGWHDFLEQMHGLNAVDNIFVSGSVALAQC